MAVPSEDELIAYWSKLKPDSAISLGWDSIKSHCWRCGTKESRNGKKLDRCHIVPASRGGDESVSNMVLLCHPCHELAPNVKDPRFMWLWIERTSSPHYWTEQAIDEYSRLFGSDWQHDVQEAIMNRLLVDEIKAKPGETGNPFEIGFKRFANSEHLPKPESLEDHFACTHFGQPRDNRSTVACTYRYLLEVYRDQTAEMIVKRKAAS